jgi:putative DNA primase/helicase
MTVKNKKLTKTPDINLKRIIEEAPVLTQVLPEYLIKGAIDPKKALPLETQVPEINRPCYAVYDDWISFSANPADKKKRAGVYYHGIKTNSKGEETTFDEYICDPLHIDAGSCDSTDNNFGLMLRFKNQCSRWTKWLMPLAMLAGGCEELRAELLRQGLNIDHHKRGHLPNYLQSQRPKKRLECALKVGWHNDCFVLPNRVIGHRDDIFFQTDHAVTAEYTQRGSLKDWRQHLSRYCADNPVLIFHASVGFAGPLLKPCHIDYVGFHWFGDSSKGKSTGHKIAASIWGGEGYRKSWRATSNGLEAAAVLYNDNLLALDEMGDSDAREINQVIYALGNGTGKQRANVRGTARAVQKWRIVLLSNGEKTLESHFQEKGLPVKAGQSVRLLQIPVFGQYGAFDDLHGMKDGRLFSDTLQKNTADYYGTSGIAYLEKLVKDHQDFDGLLEASLQLFTAEEMQPQELRAARAFALVGMAGELATDYGITGWHKNAAIDAALKCFAKWRNYRGNGASEDKAILESIKDFLDRNGDSRFSAKNITEYAMRINRAGWWYVDEDNSGRIYLFTSAGLKDASVGYDQKRVIEALTKAGWLRRDSEGHPKTQYKIQGRNDRYYVIAVKESG